MISNGLFQSTPVITDGRTKITRAEPFAAQVFQSTPVITDGRTVVATVHTLRLLRFQSTPVITDGRTSLRYSGPNSI